MNAGSKKDTIPAVKSSETIIVQTESHNCRDSTLCQSAESRSAEALSFDIRSFIPASLCVVAGSWKAIQLFCIKNGGGNASILSELPSKLSSRLHLRPIRFRSCFPQPSIRSSPLDPSKSVTVIPGLTPGVIVTGYCSKVGHVQRV